MRLAIISLLILSFGLTLFAEESGPVLEMPAKPSVKKHRRQRARRHALQKSRRVPAGLPTVLPEKKALPSTPETLPATSSSLSATREELATVVPRINQFPKFSALANLTFGSIEESGQRRASRYLELKPELRFQTGESFSFFLNFATNWVNSDGAETRHMGRPEIGALSTWTIEEEFRWGVGLSVKPPLYESNDGNSERRRIWGVNPALLIDQNLWGSGIHLGLQTTGVFESAAQYDQAGTTLRSAALLSYDATDVTYGLAYHQVNGLGSGRINTGGASREYEPVSLSFAEVFGRYEVVDGTALSLSLTKNLSLNQDPAYQGELENIQDVSDSTVTFGFSQEF